MNLKQFIQEISPNQSEISMISISWNEIRNTIENGSDIIFASFLTWSYSRHTKIHPIDDLDIFFSIDFSNTWYQECNQQYIIYIEENSIKNHQLKDFIVDFEWKKCISPIRIINHIWNIVKKRYSTTEIKWRDWQCYTTFLSSKNLTIDCVPCCGVKLEDYFLIPKWWNNIYWHKTNPKIDEEKINKLNNLYNNRLKWIIKIIKYWNKKKKLNIRSYHLECLVYYAFYDKCNTDMTYLELLKYTIEYIYFNIKDYWNIKNLPWYDYMYYDFSDRDKKNILYSIEQWYSYFTSEENVIAYFKN